MQYYTTKKMDKLLLCATTWMYLMSIMWNKKSHTQKNIYFMILFVQNSKAGKTPQLWKSEEWLCWVGLVTKRGMREILGTGNSLFLDLYGS